MKRGFRFVCWRRCNGGKGDRALKHKDEETVHALTLTRFKRCNRTHAIFLLRAALHSLNVKSYAATLTFCRVATKAQEKELTLFVLGKQKAKSVARRRSSLLKGGGRRRSPSFGVSIGDQACWSPGRGLLLKDTFLPLLRTHTPMQWPALCPLDM